MFHQFPMSFLWLSDDFNIFLLFPYGFSYDFSTFSIVFLKCSYDFSICSVVFLWFSYMFPFSTCTTLYKSQPGVVPNNFKSSACMLGLEVWIWLVGGVSLLAFAWHFSKCFTSMQVTIAWNTIMQILPQYLNWSPICLFNPIQATKYQC